jgi:hypothetical protein
LRFFAFLFGCAFIALGIAGFNTSEEGLLFGVFKVNLWQNALHLLAGIIACIVGFMSPRAIRLFFQIFGILCGLLGIMGFVYEDQNILGIIANNPAMTWLHIIAATNALILGYGEITYERN